MILVAVTLSVSNLVLIFAVIMLFLQNKDLLDRVETLENTAVGDDGQTVNERWASAQRYMEGPGKRMMTDEEIQALLKARRIVPDGMEDGEPG